MDGFDTLVGVIIMAPTNRPRPWTGLAAGRPLRPQSARRTPTSTALETTCASTQKDRAWPRSSYLFRHRPQDTPVYSVADLANAMNEGRPPRRAATTTKDALYMDDLEEAVDRIMGGLEKKNRVINPKEKRIVAFHETGHALVATYTPGSDAVHKISIVPRGIGALGWTQQLPTEDRYLMTKTDCSQNRRVLGGRAAERLVFGDISTGAHNDLQRATDIARAMVTEYGMGQTLGPATYPRQARPVFLTPDQSGLAGRDYSEATAARLDIEVKDILEAADARVADLLVGKKELLEKVAAALLEKEVLDEAEFQALIA
jgi:cell division protease FtsH